MSPAEFKFNTLFLRFEEPNETKYLINRLKQDVFGFRLLFFTLLILNPLILFFDFQRTGDLTWTIYTRVTLEILILLILYLAKGIKELDAIRYQPFIFTSSFLFYFSLIILESQTHSNFYKLFLPNFTAFIFFINASFIGLPFRRSSPLNLCIFITYASYAIWTPKEELHVTQMGNIFSFLIMSTVISYLFERKNRLLFLNNLVISKQKSVIVNANNELCKQNEIRNKLISILSHDVKAPLTSLQKILEMKMEGSMSSEDMEKHFGNISKSVNGVLKFTRQMILWIKTQMKGFEIQPVIINVNTQVTEVIDLCTNQASQKKIELVCEIDKNQILSCDKEMFIIVMRNLVSNAIKFSHENSKIIIKDLKERGKYTLSIIDTGIGISSQKLKTVFALSKSTIGTKNEDGTGLGLPISFNLMDKMGGYLSCESEENNGSKFYMVFYE